MRVRECAWSFRFRGAKVHLHRVEALPAIVRLDLLPLKALRYEQDSM